MCQQIKKKNNGTTWNDLLDQIDATIMIYW